MDSGYSHRPLKEHWFCQVNWPCKVNICERPALGLGSTMLSCVSVKHACTSILHRPYKDAQDRLLWRDKTKSCGAGTWRKSCVCHTFIPRTSMPVPKRVSQDTKNLSTYYYVSCQWDSAGASTHHKHWAFKAVKRKSKWRRVYARPIVLVYRGPNSNPEVTQPYKTDIVLLRP